MRNFIAILLSVSAALNLFSQAPGNTSSNLVLWLKPSSFTPAKWSDLSPTLNHFTQSTANRQAAVASNFVNYNVVVEFANESSSNWDFLNGNVILLDNQKNFSVFTMIFPMTSTGPYSSIIEFKRKTGSRFEIQRNTSNQLQFDAVKMSSVDAASPIVNGTPNFRPLIGSSIANGTQIVTGLNGVDGTPQSNPLITTSNSGVDGGARISSNTSGRGPLNAYLGDIIVYNAAVSPLNRRKIETYLAIKYGITLQANYVNTDGTVIYDVSSNNKNIIGIGRDDSSTLLQKQSQNPTDSTRIYIGSLATSNATNAGTISNDVSHVVMGDNGGTISRTSAAVSEMPAGLISRIEREWKITKTNFNQTFSIDMKMSPSSVPGSITVADLRLLVDDDGNFANGGTTVYQNGDANGTTITYFNGLLSISNIGNTHFPNNSSLYFTIASAGISTPLPIELIRFEAEVANQQVALKWQTGSERNNDFFTIERSTDGLEWLEIREIEGAGSSSTTLNYEAYDEHPLNGISYYRLKQTDYDGVFTYSDVKSVHVVRSMNSKVLIYPNPAENQVTVEATKSELEEVRIFDMLGKEVTSLAEITRENATRIVIDVRNLPKGVYNVKTKSTTTKVIIE